MHFLKSIFTATLCISVTFFPFLIVLTGEFHDFLLSFPWAITIVLFISMIIAQTLLPILQYFFIKKPIEAAKPKNGKKPFNLLDVMDKYYKILLAWCFRHPWTTIGIGVAGFFLGVFIFSKTPVIYSLFTKRR